MWSEKWKVPFWKENVITISCAVRRAGWPQIEHRVIDVIAEPLNLSVPCDPLKDVPSDALRDDWIKRCLTDHALASRYPWLKELKVALISSIIPMSEYFHSGVLCSPPVKLHAVWINRVSAINQNFAEKENNCNLSKDVSKCRVNLHLVTLFDTHTIAWCNKTDWQGLLGTGVLRRRQLYLNSGE